MSLREDCTSNTEIGFSVYFVLQVCWLRQNFQAALCWFAVIVVMSSYYYYYYYYYYVVGPKSFRPDIQKPRQMENAVRDI